MTVHGLKVSRVRRLGIDHGIDEGQVVAAKQPWRGRTEIRDFLVLCVCICFLGCVCK